MRNSWFYLVLSILITSVLVISCADEEITNDTLTFEEQLKLDQLEHEKYVQEHGEVTIEYMTLEELQAFYSEKGLPPVSQSTIELYNKARIKGFEKTSGPCSSWINFCGDLNRNGTFSAGDAAYFITNCNSLCNIQSCGYSTTCPTGGLSSTDAVRTFGYLSWYDPADGTQQLFFSKRDKDSADRFILGLISPC